MARARHVRVRATDIKLFTLRAALIANRAQTPTCGRGSFDFFSCAASNNSWAAMLARSADKKSSCALLITALININLFSAASIGLSSSFPRSAPLQLTSDGLFVPLTKKVQVAQLQANELVASVHANFQSNVLLSLQLCLSNLS